MDYYKYIKYKKKYLLLSQKLEQYGASSKYETLNSVEDFLINALPVFLKSTKYEDSIKLSDGLIDLLIDINIIVSIFKKFNFQKFEDPNYDKFLSEIIKNILNYHNQY